MKLRVRLVLLLLVAGVSSGLGDKESRQSAGFTASNQYVDSVGSEPSQTVYDTLSAKRPDYNQGKQLPGSTGNSFGYSSVSADTSGSYTNTYSAPAVAPAYQPQGNRPVQTGYPDSSQAQPTIRPFQPDGGYSKPQGAIYHPQTQKPEESYAYYYQHYPGQGPQGGSHGHSYGVGHGQGYGGGGGGGGISSLWQGDAGGGSDIFGGFGDLGGSLGGLGGGLGGAGLAGLGGLGGLGAIGLAALAKGILAIKPLLIIGALLLLTLPLLILFLPIPIISLSPPATGAAIGRTTARQLFSSAVSTLSEKVLNSEECLERIICKMPAMLPEKIQSQAKTIWEGYGPKYVKNARVQRGLEGFFEDSETKHRAFKCNQKFKCTSKFF